MQYARRLAFVDSSHDALALLDVLHDAYASNPERRYRNVLAQARREIVRPTKEKDAAAPLIWASRADHVAVVDKLLRAGVRHECEALIEASAFGRSDVVDRLLVNIGSTGFPYPASQALYCGAFRSACDLSQASRWCSA